MQDAVAYLKRQHHVQTDAQLQAQLTTQQLTMSELRRHLERAIMGFYVRDSEVFESIGVTDDEARQYFDAHVDEFPLQTFELAKVDLIIRLRRGKLGTALASESYLRPLRASATIVWMRPELPTSLSGRATTTRRTIGMQRPSATSRIRAVQLVTLTTTHSCSVGRTNGLRSSCT